MSTNNPTTKCGNCQAYHTAQCPAETPGESYYKHYDSAPYQDDPSCFKPKEDRGSQADYLSVIGFEAELFKDDEGELFAAVPVGKHTEIWPIRSQHFKRWLVGKYYSETQKAPNTDAVNQALNVLESKATFDGPTRRLWLRVAEHQGAFWYDLGDSDWRAVRITPEGWEVVDYPPILFKRYKNSAPQVLPEPGGDLRALLKLINVDGSQEKGFTGWDRLNDDDILQIVHVVVLLVPEIPKPILMIYGSKGAIKSTGQWIIKQSVDPADEPLLTLRRDEKELAIQLAHNYFPVFDNISDLTESQNDMLCRAATGAGFSSRQLYTDEEERIFKFKRPIGLNGIHLIAGGTDLQDRFLAIERKRIPDERRREQQEVLNEFEAIRPEIVSAILTALSRAMAMKPTINQPRLPRMADFTIWGCAVAKALGIGESRFLRAYYNNINYVNDRVLESYPLAAAILQFMSDKKEWSGTATELLDRLDAVAETMRISPKDDWPKSTTWLSRRINELSSNLADSGIDVVFDRERRRTIRFQKGSTNSVLSVNGVADYQINGASPSAHVDANVDAKKNSVEIASMVDDGKNDGDRRYDAIDAILPLPLGTPAEVADPPLSDTSPMEPQPRFITQFCKDCQHWAGGPANDMAFCTKQKTATAKNHTCEDYAGKPLKEPGSVKAQLAEETLK